MAGTLVRPPARAADSADTATPTRRRLASSSAPWSTVAVIVAVAVAVPVLLLAVGVLQPNTAMWSQQWRTRLPGQLLNTFVLLAGTAAGSCVLGASLAWVVSAYRFPGVRLLSGALILPLAVPGYILGFLTLSTFGRTGPIQDQWAAWFGRDAWFPPVESIGGAIVTFTLVLYPYVYLLARAALRDQAAGAYHAARVLGAGPGEAARRIVLPLVRPAIAAGAAVVMMETLTDFATVQYFGVDTVTVGVFRIWRGTYDRDAASELATLVLGFALLAIGLERVARRRARFGEAAGSGGGIEPVALRGGRAALATALCALPVLLAFAGPVARLVVWAVQEQTSARGTPQLEQYPSYLSHSLQLVAVTVVVVMVVATLLANAMRFGRATVTRAAARVAVFGYAVPGPVVGMGVLLAVVGLDDVLERVGGNLPGVAGAGSLLVLFYAYAVRFLAPGLGAVESGIETVSEAVTASARTLGANPLRTMVRVHLPLARASLVAGAILVGVDTLKELPIVLLLRPFGFDTLPVWVYDLAAESRFQQAALPALSIVAVAVLPVLLLSRQLERAT
ncbi:MAG: ABC transporter permease [Acidimicrobiia bacterium]